MNLAYWPKDFNQYLTAIKSYVLLYICILLVDANDTYFL